MTASRSKSNLQLEHYLMNTMFEKSLFSDLSLVFFHPSFPFSMIFNVHKSIVSQSPFLFKLLNNAQHNNSGPTSLTIDLSKALTHCGFILAPFQHIVRRKWQKTTHVSATSRPQEHHKPLLAFHIRFVLQWMYTLGKAKFLESMPEDDTLRILSVAVLLDLHDLTQACVTRYTTRQLCLDSIMRDLETICQLPRGHPSYLQLRDAALLLLFRQGPENASRLAMLPVDYMADVLSADPLFVGCEYERYCLLRAVLMSFMQSVGKITWTPKGPVDQDAKRLSGFVRPLRPKFNSILTADQVRSRKRKRIPSQELEGPIVDALENSRLNRLSFTALVPFEKLVADASSGGVIDKATVLSYLLRTTVNYSNMTFDQLTSVRQDGIVDEGIVFRALWQREALERVLFPLTYHQQTQEQEEQENTRRRGTPSIMEDHEDEERTEALNEYFDVDDSDAQEKRRRLLLGTPRFRFRSSITITPPQTSNGWQCEDKEVAMEDSAIDLHAFDDGESDGSLWTLSDTEQAQDMMQVDNSQSFTPTPTVVRKRSVTMTKKPYKLYKKTFYSEAESILGISYRVQIEAQVMPRHRLIIQDQVDTEKDQQQELSNANHDEPILVCRFELQRDKKQIALPPPLPIKKEGVKKKVFKPTSSNIPIPVTIHEHTPKPMESTPQQQQQSDGIREKTKIHYWIHCLNRHEGILESNRIDPEDRVLVAVTEQREREDGGPGEMGPGYVGQVLVEADLTKNLTIDATVALEIFGFQKV